MLSRIHTNNQSPIASELPQGTVNDLLTPQYPDSANILIERYNKFLQLIKIIENFAEGYRSIASSNIKQYDTLNKSTTSQMPNFESNPAGDAAVSGSVKTVGKDSLPSPVASAGSVSSPASPMAQDLKIDDAVEDTDLTAPVTAPAETDLNVFLAVMRNTLGQLYSSSIELENKIKSQVVPSLKMLYADVEKKQKDFSTISSKELKELRKLHASSLKGVKKLDASVSEFSSLAITGKMDYSHDPYLVKRELLKDAAIQVHAENDRVEFLTNSEHSMENMEESILRTLKKTFNLLISLLVEFFGERISSFNEMDQLLESIPNTLEWDKFLSKNSQYLTTVHPHSVDQAMDSMSLNPTKSGGNPYKKDLDSIDFKNKSNPATIPILEGVLARKEGTLTKKYNSYYFVITRSKFLYCFPSRAVDSFEPNLVLYLPDCLLKDTKSDGKFKFILRGKDASSTLPKPKRKYEFKASSSDEFSTWYNVLAEVSGLSLSNENTKAHIMSDADPTDEE